MKRIGQIATFVRLLEGIQNPDFKVAKCHRFWKKWILQIYPRPRIPVKRSSFGVYSTFMRFCLLTSFEFSAFFPQEQIWFERFYLCKIIDILQLWSRLIKTLQKDIVGRIQMRESKCENLVDFKCQLLHICLGFRMTRKWPKIYTKWVLEYSF